MTQSPTPEQLETFADQMDAVGILGSQVHRDRAAALRAAAKASPPTAYRRVQDFGDVDDVHLHNVDIPSFEKGWVTQWRRPTESYICPGETAGVLHPDGTNEPQVWLKFRSTDGNDYFDFIAIAYQRAAAGKLRSILDAIGIPYLANGADVSFHFGEGYPCTLIFKDLQGRSKNEVRLVDALAPGLEAA